VNERGYNYILKDEDEDEDKDEDEDRDDIKKINDATDDTE
jgi:hypothetical protein